jgi:hypothetical protein
MGSNLNHHGTVSTSVKSAMERWQVLRETGVDNTPTHGEHRSLG